MNTLRYAELCERAYRTRTGRAGTIEYLETSVDGATCYAFRGTSKNSQAQRGPGWWQSVKDWTALIRDVIHDIRIAPVKDKYLGWRPAGFLHAAHDVLDEIQPTLCKTTPIDLCGHSLGGACAALVAESLIQQGYWVRHVVLFGSPQCGPIGRVTSTLSSTRIRSYKFGRDVVCSVPPFWKKPSPLIPIGVSTDRLHDHGMGNYLAWFRHHA